MTTIDDTQQSEKAVIAETPDNDLRDDTDVQNTESLDDELPPRHSLQAELREIQSATENDKMWGTVVDVSETADGEGVTIAVEIPVESYRETFRFAKPKPPLDEYTLTHVANEYGQGLTDITALEGEQVPCRYDGDSDSWSLVEPSSFWERLDPRSLSLRSPGSYVDIIMFTVFAPTTIVVGTIFSLVGEGDDFANGVALTTIGILLWSLLIGAIVLV